MATTAKTTAKTKTKTETAAEPTTRGTPPTLHFTAGGWSEKLHTSYFPGYHTPRSWEEYEALKPFADNQ